ncbi:MAG: tRNA (adenosine(37)-N6)-dimethylallyltransferase MiaA [Clostridia bacterium]|nr:tRNA (adenosine(37)-N6)-dimethylallyltransferase MiaA [Clostridia bacterium]
MQKLVSVVGTTASGKSDLGIVLAQTFGGEIVSCDSRQIFKGLDLGTGKVTKEEQQMAVHHLLDIKNPNDYFSAKEYQKLAYNAINDILARGKRPFLVGGTGLYSRAVCEGFNMGEEEVDEELRNRINTLTKEQIEEEMRALGQEIPDGVSPRHLARRLEKAIKGIQAKESQPLYEVMQLVLVPEREELYKRIEIRLDKRLQLGMVEEVRTLKENGATEEFLEGLGLEYRYTNRYLNGRYSYEDYRAELLKEIRHFAKRQITWFKKEKNAIWLDMNGDFTEQAIGLCQTFYKK